MSVNSNRMLTRVNTGWLGAGPLWVVVSWFIMAIRFRSVNIESNGGLFKEEPPFEW